MPTVTANVPYFKCDNSARVILKITHKKERRFIPSDIYVFKTDLTRDEKIRRRGFTIHAKPHSSKPIPASIMYALLSFQNIHQFLRIMPVIPKCSNYDL